MNDLERRNLGIPFQQCGHASGQFVRQAVQIPDRVDHLTVMRVDAIRAAIGVARQMALHDAVVWNGANVFKRVEFVVDAGNEYVVYIEQQAAIGLLGHATDEFPFGHGGSGKRHVAARILQHERTLHHILHDPNPLDHMR